MGDDGDFLHRFSAFLHSCHQGVAHFMVRHQTLFLFRKHGAFLFAAGNDRFKRHQQIVLVHRVTAQPHSAQSCFVDQVGKVGAHAPGGGLATC